MPTTDPHAIVELRQYTLHPQQREVLIDLFDREFVETQEAQGMRVLGQFVINLALPALLFNALAQRKLADILNDVVCAARTLSDRLAMRSSGARVAQRTRLNCLSAMNSPSASAIASASAWPYCSCSARPVICGSAESCGACPTPWSASSASAVSAAQVL